MNENSGFHSTRQNVNAIVRRSAVHPVHEGISDMERSDDGLTHVYRRMYVPR